MSHLLLQSCSASKRKADGALPALEMYTGYFYKIFDKSIRNDEFRPDVDIAILSAKHGVLDPDDEIEYYDQRMDRERAMELNSSVLDTIATRVNHGSYKRIVINIGQEYRRTIVGLSNRVETPILEIPGGGIGEKGSALYKFIRGDDSVLSEVDEI